MIIIINMEKKMYYTYMLRCEDNSIYTGSTSDLERRIKEHFEQADKGAKYNKKHKIKKLEIAWSCLNYNEALKLEYHIKKRLSKSQKEDLINNYRLLKRLIKIDTSLYKKVSKSQISAINSFIKTNT